MALDEDIFLKFLEIANKWKNSQKLNKTLDMLCITYKKLLWSNSNLNFYNVPNLVTLVQILWNFS
jgi:hypothetical protein